MTNRVCPEDLLGQEAVSVRQTPGPRASSPGTAPGAFPSGEPQQNAPVRAASAWGASPAEPPPPPPTPQASPKETCPEQLRGRTPGATALSEPPHSPATRRPHRRPETETAAAPRSLQVVQGVDAAGGLPVPAAHPAAGAAEHAGGGRLLRPAGPTAS